MMKCCFGQRAWIGLGVLVAGLLIAGPQAGWVALPVLAGLACPVPMIVMMRGMRRDTEPGTAPGGEQAAGSRAAGGERAAEIARLRRVIELLRARAGGHPVAAAGTGAAAGASAAAGRADRAGRGRPAVGG